MSGWPCRSSNSGSVRAALIPAVTVPVCLIAAFIALSTYMGGETAAADY